LPRLDSCCLLIPQHSCSRAMPETTVRRRSCSVRERALQLLRSPTVALDISRSRLNLGTIQSMPSERDSTSDTPGSLPGCRVAETFHLCVRRCCRRLPVWDCVKSICKIRPHGGGRDKFEELAGRLVRLEPRRAGGIFYKGRRDGCWVLRR
jgi:hypothetical protein